MAKKTTEKINRKASSTVEDVGVYVNLLTDFGFKRIFWHTLNYPALPKSCAS